VIRRSVLAAPLLVAATVLAACSSSDDEAAPSSTAAPTTTTTEVADARPAYEGRGPHPVGTLSFALADGRRVVAWYPAAPDAADQPKETFDIASLLSPELQAQIAPELRPQYELDAHPGADPAADGPYPVVLFSHGYAGFPEQSADLTSQLASWGFVVVAPDHVERSLSGLLGTAAAGVDPLEDPAVLTASLDAAAADAERAGSPLQDLLDLENVAVVGHSAGARAAYLTATADERVDAFIAYSVGLTGGPDAGAVEPPPTPDVPGMVMIGEADGIIPADTSRAVYDAMAAPKHLVEIADAGHLVFSDLCLIGRDQGGLVGLVAEAGLDLPESLLGLASDGCEDDALLPSDAFGAINHFSVAFLRYSLGIDEEPVGLDSETASAFTTADVSFESDPG
jgi:dienelactone hydrolase